MAFTLVSEDTDICTVLLQYHLIWLPVPVVTKGHTGMCSTQCLSKLKYMYPSSKGVVSNFHDVPCKDPVVIPNTGNIEQELAQWWLTLLLNSISHFCCETKKRVSYMGHPCASNVGKVSLYHLMVDGRPLTLEENMQQG